MVVKTGAVDEWYELTTMHTNWCNVILCRSKAMPYGTIFVDSQFGELAVYGNKTYATKWTNRLFAILPSFAKREFCTIALVLKKNGLPAELIDLIIGMVFEIMAFP